MKKFYREVQALKIKEGYSIRLDGKPLKTPSGKWFLVPFLPLAEAVAAEWDTQKTEIRPREMFLTQLSNTVIDKVSVNRQAVVDEILGYIETDLVCYRASEPKALKKKQTECWDPLLSWLGEKYNIKLYQTKNLLPLQQPPESFSIFLELIVELDDFLLGGLHKMVLTLGSLVVSFAVLDGLFDSEAACKASLVDEVFQVQKWGADEDFRIRSETLRLEIKATTTFLELCAGMERAKKNGRFLPLSRTSLQ